MGLLDRMFGRKRAEGGEVIAMTPEDAITIVQDYCALLESGTNLPGPGCVADVRHLPHPKERIKRAVRSVLVVSTDPQLRNALANGYLLLADWQVGVGDRVVGMDPKKWVGDIDAQAKIVLDQTSAMEKWNAVVEAEAESLRSDLKQLGIFDGNV